MRVGVLLVTHQSAQCLRECLDAVRRYANAARIVVVDNASTDESCAIAASTTGVELLSNHRNAGFAGAVNQGFRELADCDLVLLLNPDAILLDNIAPLIALFDERTTAIASGQLVDPSTREPQRGFTLRRFPTPAALTFENLGLNRLWPNNSVNRHWRALDVDLTAPCIAEQPPGAFLLIRHADWHRIHGFDERFHPVWFEDVDFCLRVHRSGGVIRYLPTVRAAHAGGHSIATLASGDRQLYWYQNLLRYAGIHFRRNGLLVCALSAAIGAFGRGMWQAIRRGSLSSLKATGAVLGSSARATRNALQGKSVEGPPVSTGDITD